MCSEQCSVSRRRHPGADPRRGGGSLYCSASLRPLERFHGLRRMPTLRLQEPAAQVRIGDVIQVVAMQEAYVLPAHADSGQSINEVKGQSVWCHSSSQLPKGAVVSILTGRWQSQKSSGSRHCGQYPLGGGAELGGLSK